MLSLNGIEHEHPLLSLQSLRGENGALRGCGLEEEGVNGDQPHCCPHDSIPACFQATAYPQSNPCSSAPTPDGSLPSPCRFWGEHRLLPLEADARDGELPILAALRSSAPAELRAPHAPHLSTGTLGASPSMGCQRRVAIGVLFFFFESPFYF